MTYSAHMHIHDSNTLSTRKRLKPDLRLVPCQRRQALSARHNFFCLAMGVEHTTALGQLKSDPGLSPSGSLNHGYTYGVDLYA